eukprot:TRINITY_DN5542_c0_g1_i2.p1 TRINITY_DN5542_c0_g1~~TRINITY_DN5542_c0_g1_i2.p1  ORF type:complete len:660 (+),score=157.10 TRINITY_DN5542_c0_g1_i2:470-2449(+)
MAECASIDHPLFVTETVCNPSYSRKHMSELLFECFDVPSLTYGIDALCSLFLHHNRRESRSVENVGGGDGGGGGGGDSGGGNGSNGNATRISEYDALVVSAGHHTTHVLPVLSGHFQASQSTRVNVGGYHDTAYLQKSLALRYPVQRAALTTPVCEALKIEHCHVASSYRDDLKMLIPDGHPENRTTEETRVIQVPIPTKLLGPAPIPEAEQQRRTQARKDNMSRMREQAGVRRAEKIGQNLAYLEVLLDLPSLRERDPKAYVAQLLAFKIKAADIEDEVAYVRSVLSKLEAAAERQRLKEASGSEEDNEEGDDDADDTSAAAVDPALLYPMLFDPRPDNELTDDERAARKGQRFAHNMSEARERARIRREEQREQQEKETAAEEERRRKNPAAFAKELHSQRTVLLASIADWDKANNKHGRHSAAQTKRMSLLAQAAFSQDEGEERFGASDKDWNVYLDMTGDAQRDEEEVERARLAKIETLLREYDADFLRTDREAVTAAAMQKEAWSPFLAATAESDYRLHLIVDRIRTPELRWQPAALMGVDQMGLADVINCVVSRFPADQQSRLAQSVFLTGGSSRYPGMRTRIETDLRMNRPFESPISVQCARDALLDAWRGAALWARCPDTLARSSVTRQEYEEHGSHYFVQHALSNVAYDL